MRVTVTGGSGFVGQALIELMSVDPEVSLTAPLRRPLQDAKLGMNYVIVDGAIGGQNWLESIVNCDVVVHLAGRAHVLHDSMQDRLTAFRKVNVEGTLNLARMARDNGVKRFVFISSIGVNGASTVAKPVNENAEAAPYADYALSKWEAEQGLWDVVSGSKMELVIIRPPLVYAGHAPGNFGRLLSLVGSGVPLPLAAVRNRRSLVALENLVDFVALCATHPAAANQVFVVSDGQDVSTPDIIRLICKGMNKSSRLFPVPRSWLQTAARVVGKSGVYTQLCDSLVVDSSKARQLLGWNPVISVDTALKKAGFDFISERAKG